MTNLMQALETKRLKRYKKILKLKKQMEKEEKNTIQKNEEPTNKKKSFLK
jgi:hypothetical protein